MVQIPVREQLATDQIDPWQVVPRQVFTPYVCSLISVAFSRSLSRWLSLGDRCGPVSTCNILAVCFAFESVVQVYDGFFTD